MPLSFREVAIAIYFAQNKTLDMSTSQTLDPEAIANLRALSPDDGDVFLREILSIFIEDTPNRIAELHSSLASGAVPTFVRAAHSIKGSSSNVGANELRTVAEKLEHDSRSVGLAGIEGQVAELEAAFERVKTALQPYLAG